MSTKFHSARSVAVRHDADAVDSPITNRRIGERRDASLPVRVKPLGQHKRRPFRSHTPATLANVSVSGGAITCKALRGVQMYSVVEVEGEKGHAVVRVERISQLDSGEVEYGVVLLDADPAMQRVFHGAGLNGDADADWRWMAAQ